MRKNEYPLPKQPLIKHEPIDTAILYSLVKSNYEKSPGKSQYIKVDRTRWSLTPQQGRKISQAQGA